MDRELFAEITTGELVYLGAVILVGLVLALVTRLIANRLKNKLRRWRLFISLAVVSLFRTLVFRARERPTTAAARKATNSGAATIHSGAAKVKARIKGTISCG